MDGLIIPRADLERMNRERAEMLKALAESIERLEMMTAAHPGHYDTERFLIDARAVSAKAEGR